MRPKKHKIFATLTVPVALLPVLVLADSFVISRHSVDGGGVMRSTGGGFELSGTIGQPAAGPESSGMTGGSFALTGGLWFSLALDDCNSDG